MWSDTCLLFVNVIWYWSLIGQYFQTNSAAGVPRLWSHREEGSYWGGRGQSQFEGIECWATQFRNIITLFLTNNLISFEFEIFFGFIFQLFRLLITINKTDKLSPYYWALIGQFYKDSIGENVKSYKWDYGIKSDLKWTKLIFSEINFIMSK